KWETARSCQKSNFLGGSKAVTSLTIQVTNLIFSPSLFFALSITDLEISNTVKSVKPRANKWSTKKLSPPPVPMISADLEKPSPLMNFKDVLGIGWYQLT
ncbi:MAG: hypothetical protein QMB24_00730, partial [Spirosomataceae bacterium]